MKQAQAWIRAACELFDVEIPTVRKATPAYDKASFYRPVDHSITLQRRHLNIFSSLHEAAHAIVADRYPKEYDVDNPHSKRWLGVFVHLLEYFQLIPSHAVRPSLAYRRLDFTRTSPKKRRKRKGRKR